MPDSEKRERLEGLLTFLKMARTVGLYQIDERGGQLFLHVNLGDAFEGDDLAKEIAELSKGDIQAERITVRTAGSGR
jgi:hypothetical protein